MKASTDHILTSHAGSLPRPDELIEAWGANDERALTQKLTAAVAEVVRRQRDLGIDIPGDGEYGKSMPHSVNYGA
ncbi:MAG: epoxyalkane--coenzyme M transferase, partial [Alphaproteobacteria bacterium]|nr:epoxyalkane--coenzyme M transferase [Alphaproteobacteria bacterium]